MTNDEILQALTDIKMRISRSALIGRGTTASDVIDTNTLIDELYKSLTNDPIPSVKITRSTAELRESIFVSDVIHAKSQDRIELEIEIGDRVITGELAHGVVTLKP